MVREEEENNLPQMEVIFYNLYLTYYQINMLPAKLERELFPPLEAGVIGSEWEIIFIEI